MQQIAKDDVTEKLNQFKDVATIAEKLDSSVVYESAFDKELKAEAIKQIENGFTVDLEEYQQSTKQFIQGYAKGISQPDNAISHNPTEEAPKDLATVLNAIHKDFEISEKINRDENYKNAFMENLPKDNTPPATILAKIKESEKFINDRETMTEQFNQAHGKQFPVFVIDPIAKSDLAEYQSNPNDEYKAFEIYTKMEKSDYAKSIEALYKEQAENLGLPNGENYTRNKIEHLTTTVNNLSDEQKSAFTQRFNESYPNGFKTTKEQTAEQEQAEIAKMEKIQQETERRQDEYNKQVYDYLKTEQGNEEARIKQTQYLQEMINREPQNFDRLSQNFFTKNDLRTVLPNDSLLKLEAGKLLTDDKKATPTGAKMLSENLKAKVVNSTQQLAQSGKIGEQAIKSKAQLKAYYSDKFSKEYIEAEKKLQMKRQNDKKLKVDSVKMSY